MGLDMMLYRCSKPEGISQYEHLTWKRKEELESGHVNFFDEAEAKRLCKTIFDNSVEVTADVRCYDITTILLELCEKEGIEFDPELEEEIYISSSSSEKTTFRCRDYTLEIPRENMEAYIICNRFTMYAVVMDEVDYQRKGLNERGWDLMACDNCEYTDDYDAVKAMVDEGGLSETFLTNWKEGETVFCPWW